MSQFDMSVTEPIQADMGSALEDQGEQLDLGGALDMAYVDLLSTPQLVLQDQVVSFAQSTPGITQTRRVAVSHDHDQSVTIDALKVQPSLENVSLSWWSEADGKLSTQSELELKPDEVAILLVSVEQPSMITQPESAHIDLRLKEHDTTSRLDVRIGQPGPCMLVGLPQPDDSRSDYVFDLGSIPLQKVTSHQFTITNCGNEEGLEVDDLYISRDPYDLIVVPGGHPNADRVKRVEPGEARDLMVLTQPTDSSGVRFPNIGAVTMRTNATGMQNIEVAIQAQPEEETCALLDVKASTKGAPSLVDDLSTSPLQVVALEAMLATSGLPLQPDITWALIARPATSSAQLKAPRTGAESDPLGDLRRELFLDVPGEYIVETRGDAGSCMGDRVIITATPAQDIYISTTWETPSDTIPDDRQGADVDLHYIHPQGSFEDEMFDIFWRNSEADWGQEGPQGNPILLRDDRDGVGPEVIAHEAPEQGYTYTVGVHYFEPAGFGESLVTTLIYVDGQLSAASTDQLMLERLEYIKVGTITWGAMPEVTILNERLP